jgi:hypothetical protein
MRLTARPRYRLNSSSFKDGGAWHKACTTKYGLQSLSNAASYQASSRTIACGSLKIWDRPLLHVSAYGRRRLLPVAKRSGPAVVDKFGQADWFTYGSPTS